MTFFKTVDFKIVTCDCFTIIGEKLDKARMKLGILMILKAGRKRLEKCFINT